MPAPGDGDTPLLFTGDTLSGIAQSGKGGPPAEMRVTSRDTIDPGESGEGARGRLCHGAAGLLAGPARW